MNRCLLALGLLAATGLSFAANAAEGPTATSIMSLDGTWQLATDAQNAGRAQQWFAKALPAARPAKVPWILQDVFPGYHGVVWYAREFDAPAHPLPGGRYLLRFEQVDYLAEVWLNGAAVGGHEGGETPFALDVTEQIKPGAKNRLVVRVLNPTHEMIDGITLNQTAKRCKVIPFNAGAAFNHGGITGAVTLACTPEVYVEDLYVTARPQGDSGAMHVQAAVRNAAQVARKGQLEITVASARSGETTAIVRLPWEFPAGVSQADADLTLDRPRLWQLNDPYLYRVTVRATVDGAAGVAERSTRCGFRDFRFTDGYFRLNGKRIFLRSCHTCNHYPIGLQFPTDPDLLRRDMLNLKVMGFNAVRFIWGAATPAQLDLCDEMGFMVYEETYASWSIAPSPKMAERFDAGVGEVIRRDRNHPCVVMWGLLNEAVDNPAFHYAIKMLPQVRKWDDTRIVMLNSGRYDVLHGGGIGSVPGLVTWPEASSTEPWVGINTTKDTVQALGITWPAGALAFHPGPHNERSVVQWTAPAAGTAQVAAHFAGLAERATTDVHVLHNGRALFDGFINCEKAGNEATFDKTVTVAAGDTLACMVGWGNNSHGGDTTGLSFRITLGEKTYDATADFSPQGNPHGAWSYGQLPADDAQAKLALYGKRAPLNGVGSLANPGSNEWEDVISDRHLYPRVPHLLSDIRLLRTVNAGAQPVFLSEYGIGSAVDLCRTIRHYEQQHAMHAEDAQFLRACLDRYLQDWKQWRLDELYARPDDFFMESLRKMAGQRTLGFNAIRSNPHIVGHSMTCAIEEVLCGEGLTTAFREFKPGTFDAMFDGWAPLRWCLFAEQVHLRRGEKIHLEAVLANEDVLSPGEYPARLQVVGPQGERIFAREIQVTIPARENGVEPPYAQLCFSDDVVVDGPAGKYRFLATFLHNAAAAGGTAEFYVTDPADMPVVEQEIVFWGDDPELVQWLQNRGIRVRPFAARDKDKTKVILAARKPEAAGDEAAFAALTDEIKRGATVVFLCPEVFAKGQQSTGWLPLANKGRLGSIYGWLYLKDEWAKRHPLFADMPCGGLLDYNYYREIIPDLVWQGQDPPDEAVAGAIKASQDYASGLMLAVYRVGAGRIVLNTLRIRQNLAGNPAAEHLLRNMLRYAANPPQ